MRPGVRVGVDVGTVRIGVSRSDPAGLLAVPVETVPRAERSDVARVLAIAEEWDALEILVGHPRALSGTATRSTRDAADFAARLAVSASRPVRLVDERLSTVSAQGALHAAGRTERSSRAVIDQAAAVVILQQALDAERATGLVPGVPADPACEEAP